MPIYEKDEKMTKEEIIERNITLTFDFLRQVVKNPSIIRDIRDNSLIEFVEKDRPIVETKKAPTPDSYFKVKHQFEKTFPLTGTGR